MPIQVTADYVVADGETIELNYDGFQSQGLRYNNPQGAPDIVIGGTATFTSAAASVYGIWTWNAQTGSVIHIEATGSLFVASTYYDPPNAYSPDHTYGIYHGSWAVPTLIDGLLDVTAQNWATGVMRGNTVINGTIRVTADLFAIGVDYSTGGSLENNGLIQVHGGYSAVGVFGHGDFVNTGTITATVDSGVSIAVLMDFGTVSSTPFVNSGILIGDWAFLSYPGGDLLETPGFYELGSPTRASTDFVINTGEMYGQIGLGFGDDTFRNSGLVDGDTDMGGGADLYDGRGGQNTGVVFGGEGDDVMIGGDGADILLGGLGADAANGGGGDDVVDGGLGSDSLDGGAGFDTLSYLEATRGVTLNLASGVATGAGTDALRGFERVVGSRWNDSFTGSAAGDTLEGAAGDDMLSGSGGDDILIGDQGADTLTGGAGADRFTFSIGDGPDTVTDFSSAAGDKIAVHGYPAYQQLVQVGADTRIVLSATDTILLKNVQATSLTAADFIFDGAPLGDLPAVDGMQSQLITQSWVVEAGETLAFNDPSSLYHQSDWYDSTAFVFQPLGGSDNVTIFNAGHIELTASPLHGSATLFHGLGSYDRLVNRAGGVLEVTSLNDGVARGAWGIDEVYNAGEIRVSSADGRGFGVFEVTVFVNTGLIIVDAARTATGIVSTGSSPALFNSGHILIYGGEDCVAVDLTAHVPGFVNSGLIRVEDSTVAIDGVGLGFASTQACSLFNLGIIEADYAVRHLMMTTSDYNFSQTLYNSGELRGQVDFGQGQGRLYNYGLITGLIDMGSESDHYDGRLGTALAGIYGGAGNDVLLAGAGEDSLFGESGDDTLSGGAGNDTLGGGGGNDSFRFEVGSGADVITDFVAGGTDDRIEVVGYAGYQSVTQQGADTLVRFSATDSLLLKNVTAGALTAADFVFSAAAIAATPAMPTPPSAAVTPTNPVLPAAPAHPLIGGASADTLTGSDAMDAIFGGGGNDILGGGDGDDTVEGGDGSDVISGGRGSDELVGGAGADVFKWVYGDGGDLYVDFNPLEGDIIRITDDPASPFSMFWYQSLTLYVGNVPFEFGAYYGAIQPYVFVDRLGTSGADTLQGEDNPNWMEGLDGADLINGGYGDDRIWGGAGNDTIDGGVGDDRIDGGAGNDLFLFNVNGWGGGRDTITGFSAGGSEDRIEAYGFSTYWLEQRGADLVVLFDQSGYASITLSGVSAANFTAVDINLTRTGPITFAGTAAAETLTGTADADVLQGAAGADALNGGNGDDILTGGSGDDALNGGTGNDLFTFAAGDGTDTITGFTAGGTDDRIEVTGFSYYTLEQVGADLRIVFDGQNAILLKSVSAAAFTAADINIPRLTIIAGSAGGEALTGGTGMDQISGLGGADTLNGAAGDDLLVGGLAADTMTGGAGHDRFLFAAGDGGDTITDFTAGGIEDRIEVTGYSTFSLQQIGADLKIVFDASNWILLKNVTAAAFTADDINIRAGTSGTAAADTMNGTSGDDHLAGLDGADTINGGAGNDFLEGGAGDDYITAGTGNELLYGGDGYDTLDLSGAASGLAAYLKSQFQPGFSGFVNDGTGVLDIIYGFERLIGTSFNDTLGVGIAEVDATLIGGDGDDQLRGGVGDDILIGGAGNDLLLGGNGADTFRFNAGLFGNDTVTDFANGTDLIQLTGIAGVDDFSDLAISANGSGWAVITLPDGSTITLNGVSDGLVDASDFVFGG